jgi:hypothetical protein
MSKLQEIIRDERRRQHGPARGPLIVMTRIVEPVLSPAGDRVVYHARLIQTPPHSSLAIRAAASGSSLVNPFRHLRSG